MKKMFALLLGIITFSDANAQWIQSEAPAGYRIWDMTAKDTNCYAAVWTIGIYRSNDDGLTWSEKNTGLNNLQIKCFDITDVYVYAAGWSVYRSNDQGENWTEVNNGLTSYYTYSLAHSDTYTYVGSVGGMIFYSADNGDLWNAISIPGVSTSVNKLIVLDTMLFAATEGDGIFRTSDNGVHWDQVNNGLTNLSILSFEASGNTLYAGTYWDKFFISTDFGENWINSTGNLPLAPDNTVGTIAVDGSGIFVGSRRGVYVSQDQGVNWYAINEGLSGALVYSLEVSGSNLIAGTDGSGIFYRSLSDIYNYLDIPAPDLSQGFSLSQNYPNPAKSGTTISFTLPCRTHVTLKIYDRSGFNVAVLADCNLAAGHHEAFFDGDLLPDGIYFYTLTARPYIQTRKMVLQR